MLAGGGGRRPGRVRLISPGKLCPNGVVAPESHCVCVPPGPYHQVQQTSSSTCPRLAPCLSSLVSRARPSCTASLTRSRSSMSFHQRSLKCQRRSRMLARRATFLCRLRLAAATMTVASVARAPSAVNGWLRAFNQGPSVPQKTPSSRATRHRVATTPTHQIARRPTYSAIIRLIFRWRRGKSTSFCPSRSGPFALQAGHRPTQRGHDARRALAPVRLIAQLPRSLPDGPAPSSTRSPAVGCRRTRATATPTPGAFLTSRRSCARRPDGCCGRRRDRRLGRRGYGRPAQYFDLLGPVFAARLRA